MALFYLIIIIACQYLYRIDKSKYKKPTATYVRYERHKSDIGLSMTTLVLMGNQTYKFLECLDDNENQFDQYNLTSIG